MTGSPTTARSQAEANLDSAQWNVGRGDRVHAAVHIAQAVAADPSFGVSYEEAERLVTAAPRTPPCSRSSCRHGTSPHAETMW